MAAGAGFTSTSTYTFGRFSFDAILPKGYTAGVCTTSFVSLFLSEQPCITTEVHRFAQLFALCCTTQHAGGKAGSTAGVCTTHLVSQHLAEQPYVTTLSVHVCAVQCCAAQFCAAVWCAVLCCVSLYCTVQYCPVVFCVLSDNSHSKHFQKNPNPLVSSFFVHTSKIKALRIPLLLCP